MQTRWHQTIYGTFLILLNEENRMKKTYLIINKHAGGKRMKNRISQLFDGFEKQSVNITLNYTEREGHAVELAQNAVADKYDIIVAVGGDGTVNEVARGLAGSGVAMGIIPMGSGNGFARELNISMNIKKAIDIIIKGKDKPVDLWQMNNRVFLCAAGLGFDAAVAKKMTLSTRRGFWEYIRLTLIESISTKPVKLTLLIGNSKIEKSVFLVSFANASQLGNNAFISPGAKPDDGLLDVVIIKPMYKIFYPVLGLALFLRIIHWFKFFERHRVDSVIIQSASSNLFHVDGESVEMEFPIHVNLVKKKLEVRVL